MKRDIFRSGALQNEFIEKGYVKFAISDPGALHHLIKEIDLLRPDDDFKPFKGKHDEIINFHVTLFDNNKEYKKQVLRLITQYFVNELNDLLIDYKIIGGSIFIKHPGCEQMEMHQHWTIADHQHTTLSCWIPLQDVDENNGAMQLLEGSHKIVQYITSTAQNEYFASFKEQLLPYFKTIPLKFGEAVIFCETLIHTSHANRSSFSRKAIQISLYPAECQLYFCYYNEQKNEFDQYKFDMDFFLDMISDRDVVLPENKEKLASIPNNNKELDHEEFIFRMNEGPNVRAQLYNREQVYVKPYTPPPDPLSSGGQQRRFYSLIKNLISRSAL